MSKTLRSVREQKKRTAKEKKVHLKKKKKKAENSPNFFKYLVRQDTRPLVTLLSPSNQPTHTHAHTKGCITECASAVGNLLSVKYLLLHCRGFWKARGKKFAELKSRNRRS